MRRAVGGPIGNAFSSRKTNSAIEADWRGPFTRRLELRLQITGSYWHVNCSPFIATLVYRWLAHTGRGYVGTSGPQLHGPECWVISSSPQGESLSRVRINDVAIEAWQDL